MTKYRTLKVIVTRLGKHRPGELGVGYSQANGHINFFPDRGGYAVVPVSDLQAVDPKATVKREATPLPFSLIEKQVKGEAKRKVVRVAKQPRRVVRKVRRIVRV